MKPPFQNHFAAAAFAVAVFTADSSAETTVLTDNFDSEASFTATPNADQAGLLAPATYTVGDPWTGGGVQRRGTGLLELGFNGTTATAGSRVFTDADYVSLANTLNSPVRFSFDIDASQVDWVGLLIGTTGAWMDGNGTTTEFSALFKNDGTGNKWVNGANQNGLTADTSSLITIELRNTVGTGSAFNGTGSVVQLWRGTTDLGSYTLEQLSATNGKFALCTYNGNLGAGGTFDNLSITASVTAVPNRWSGAADGNWDETTENFTGGSFSTVKANGATSALFGDISGTLAPVTNSSLTLADAGVEIADVIFDNNSVSYSLASSGSSGITGTSNLVKSGTGTLTVANVNTYSGSTTITGGQVLLSGGDNRLPTTTALTLTSPGVLRLDGNNQTISELTSSGTLLNGTPALATLTVDSSEDTTFSGKLGGTTVDENKLALVKNGAGVLTLSGNSSSYAGGTTINGGTLIASNTPAPGGNSSLGGAVASHVVTINNGATLTGNYTNWLDNTQVASGAANAHTVVVNAGGLLKGAAGYITGLGNVTLNGGTIEVSSGYGQWTWNATFTLGGDITVAGSSPSSIITPSGANSNAAIYLSNGSNGTGGTRTFTVNDVTNDAASDLVINARIAKGTVVKQGPGTLEIIAGETGTETPASWRIADGQWVLAANASYTCVLSNTASNSISEASGGNGAAVFNGTLTLDTTAVTATSGSWQLIDVAGLSASFDPTTFSVAGFSDTNDDGVWTKDNWSFSETTGMLTLGTTSDYDAWGSEFGLSTGTEAADLDGDGLSNFEEYAFGLLPNNPSSANPITQSLKPDGNFTYTRRATPASTGLTYKVLVSTDLSTWTEDSTATIGTITTDSGIESVPLTVSSSWLSNQKLFVRVSATKP